MISSLSGLPRAAVLALAAGVAAVLVWRVLLVGTDAYQQLTNATNQQAAAPAGGPADAPWRERLAKNPGDAEALLMLALDLESQGKKAEASAAMQQALRLAPTNERTLMEAAGYFLRARDEAQALLVLRRAVDVSRGEINSSIWDVFLQALDSEGHREFFDKLARSNPAWWPTFFRLACERAVNTGTVQAMFTTRSQLALATVDERRCIIGRLQRDDQWTEAYQLWLNTLPGDQQKKAAGHVFNGDFELPISDIGFDWRVPAQEGVEVALQPTEGVTGKRALVVAFVNKRYSAPAVYQYVLLPPGRYRFDGRGRTDLESWLGLQWGLYCEGASGGEPRQLTHSDRFVGSMDWRDFRKDFVVPKDCPVQVLRLELANPKRDANTPGAVVVRLKGRVWFDDLRIRILA